MIGLDAMAKWYQEGREPPGGWRPGWIRMVKAYIRTGKAPPPTVKKKRQATPEVAPEIQHARLTACEFCEHLQAESRKCRMCGCSGRVDDFVKRPWHRCPDGRWTRTIASL